MTCSSATRQTTSLIAGSRNGRSSITTLTRHCLGCRTWPPWPPIRLKTCFGRFSGLSSVQPATISKPAAVAPARIEIQTGIRLVERMRRNPFR